MGGVITGAVLAAVFLVVSALVLAGYPPWIAAPALTVGWVYAAVSMLGLAHEGYL